MLEGFDFIVLDREAERERENKILVRKWSKDRLTSVGVSTQ